MKLNKENIDISYKIIDYFNDSISEDEVNMILDWANKSEGNKKLFENIREIWNNESDLDSNTKKRLLKSWNKFKNSLPGSKKINLPPVLKIAATVLILSVISALILFNRYFNKQQVLIAKNQIELVTLSDSSRIAIKPGSKIILGSNFNKRYRRLELSGEAFFKVKRDSLKPFVILFGENELHVLGTSFVIREYKEKNEYHVYVKDGIVKVIANKNGLAKELILSAGEECFIANNENNAVKYRTEDFNYLSWYSKEFYFNNISLNEVLKTLSHAYDTNIISSSVFIDSLKLTARYENEPLELIVELISKTFGLEANADSTYLILNTRETETD